MTDLDMPGLPTWGVVLCALLVPILIAALFLSAFEYANRPTPGPMKPGEGQQISDMNNAMLLVHALAQLGFILVGVLFIARRPKTRVVFLVITVPFCGLVWLVSLIGLIAP